MNYRVEQPALPHILDAAGVSVWVGDTPVHFRNGNGDGHRSLRVATLTGEVGH